MPRQELRAGAAGPIGLGLLALVLLPLALITPPIAMAIFGGLAALCVFGVIVLASRKLLVDDVGVTAKGLFGQRRVEWNEVDHYTFWSMDQANAATIGAGASGGAIGVIVAAIIVAIIQSKRKVNVDLHRQFSSGRLKLVTRSGRTLAIDARYRDAGPVLERAFEELHGRLRGAHARRYDPFTLGLQELLHRSRGSLAFAEIEKVDVSGTTLAVKKRGKRLAWAKCHMRDLANGVLFLEELAERGLVVNTQAGMFVPPSILQKLVGAAARQAALPEARVVERR